MKITTVHLTQAQINEITQYVNSYRNKHHVSNLTHDYTISKVSQNWANFLSTRHAFKHSNNRQYGENLSWYSGYKNEIVKLIKLSIDKWYEEIKQYDFDNPVFSSKTGHATALLWSSSKSFGVGYSFNNLKRTAIVVMNFSPPGNIMGQFKENVLPI